MRWKPGLSPGPRCVKLTEILGLGKGIRDGKIGERERGRKRLWGRERDGRGEMGVDPTKFGRKLTPPGVGGGVTDRRTDGQTHRDGIDNRSRIV